MSITEMIIFWILKPVGEIIVGIVILGLLLAIFALVEFSNKRKQCKRLDKYNSSNPKVHRDK